MLSCLLASTLKAPALPEPHLLSLRMQVDEEAEKALGGRWRQAIEALRFNYFIQFSETLYNYEYDEYSRLLERTEALPLTMS